MYVNLIYKMLIIFLYYEISNGLYFILYIDNCKCLLYLFNKVTFILTQNKQGFCFVLLNRILFKPSLF